MTARVTVEVVNVAGLHARPCHAIVSTALEFPCSLRIRLAGESTSGSGSSVGSRGGGALGRDVNGKSILELMTLEASLGTRLEFEAEGDGQDELVQRLSDLVARGFGEQLAENGS